MDETKQREIAISLEKERYRITPSPTPPETKYQLYQKSENRKEKEIILCDQKEIMKSLRAENLGEYDFIEKYTKTCMKSARSKSRQNMNFFDRMQDDVRKRLLADKTVSYATQQYRKKTRKSKSRTREKSLFTRLQQDEKNRSQAKLFQSFDHSINRTPMDRRRPFPSAFDSALKPPSKSVSRPKQKMTPKKMKAFIDRTQKKQMEKQKKISDRQAFLRQKEERQFEEIKTQVIGYGKKLLKAQEADLMRRMEVDIENRHENFEIE